MKSLKIFLVITLFFAFSINAEEKLNEENLFNSDFYRKINPKIKLLIDDVHHERFGNALNHADELIKMDPDHPAGYFLKAAIYDNIILDYLDYRFEEPFEDIVDKAIKLGTKKLKYIDKNKLPPDHWLHFYLGGSLGFRGLHRFFKSEWFAAFSDGLNGVDHLVQCLEINKEIYDAYYGLGNFHYWVSAKSRFLWFLPFIKDQREQGLKELSLAIHKGLYTSVEARYAVLRIQNNEKLYKGALRNADKLINDYPEDVFAYDQKGYALRGMKLWKEAADNYSKQIELYMKSELHCFEKICEIAYLKCDSLSHIKDAHEIEATYLFVIEQKEIRAKKGEKITKIALRHIQGMTKIHNSVAGK